MIKTYVTPSGHRKQFHCVEAIADQQMIKLTIKAAADKYMYMCEVGLDINVIYCN